MKTKHSISAILAAMCITTACGPSRYAVQLEMRYPSRAGIELAGKNISVVYAMSGKPKADLFCGKMAESFAGVLEKDYGTGEGSVGLYQVDGRTGDYSRKDSLISLLMKTGADAVFLFDTLKIDDLVSDTVPVNIILYCYDGMDKNDKVHRFAGTAVLPASSDDSIVSEADSAGKNVAGSFTSQWKHEQYTIVYYDNAQWHEALAKADMYDWKGAMDIWLDLLSTNDSMKRSCAQYNIAVACYMLGDISLAGQWLDRSDADNPLGAMSENLRKRIEMRKASL